MCVDRSQSTIAHSRVHWVCAVSRYVDVLSSSRIDGHVTDHGIVWRDGDVAGFDGRKVHALVEKPLVAMPDMVLSAITLFAPRVLLRNADS